MRLKFTFLALIFSFGALQAQQIMTEQRTLLVKKTATWCPFCGQWGWTMMKGIMDDHDDQAIVVGGHYSGNLETDASKDLMTILTGSGQPLFFANNSNLRVNSSNVSAKRTEVKNLVDGRLAMDARIGVGVEVKDDQSGQLEVNFKAEFLEEVTGTFNVSIWVLEDGVEQVQSGRSGMQEHPNVLREALNGVKGEELATGTTPESTVISRSWKFTPNTSYNKSKLKFAAVIWQDNNGAFAFENGFVQDEIQLTTSSSDVNESLGLEIVPSILTDESRLTVQLNKAEEVSIQIFDLLGNQVAKVFKGRLSAGFSSFDIRRNSVQMPGMYLVTATNGRSKTTKRLLVK